ncbi:MAG: hypothetical protein R2776_05200 [Flavobacteriaceae bacterium]|nr:hypothetical protein [Flavobacteriaceae bacterium]
MFAVLFLTINWVLAFIVSAIVSILLANKIAGKPTIGSLFKNVGFLFLLIIGIRFLLLFLIEFVTIPTTEETTFKVEEGVAKSIILEGIDSVSVYSSNRVWKDNYGNNYQGKLAVREKDFLRLHKHINSYKVTSSANFWGSLYDYIDRTDTPSLDLVMATFEEIHSRKNLNQMEFAEMVISCIQDIPYAFVFQEACLSAENYEESIRVILENCPECCIGHVKYGIQNPVSFLQNLKGDCDTRTVLIYAILKHFNYDVAILNSEFYRHSIIGLNLPAKGLYKTYYGKKYVVWETTAKYYTAGQLPYNFNDITHWNVVLTSK